MENKITNKDVRNSIVYAFIKRKPEHFIPYLMSKKTFIDDESKVKFYKQFKCRILKSKISEKISEIKVEKEFNGFYDDYLQLNFYDENHLNPRFSIFYKYEGEEIHLGFMPF